LQQVSCPLRTDPVDEWLQVALALSIEIFLERPLLDPAAGREGPAVSTDRSGDHEASPAVAHVPRIDGWMRSFAVSTKAAETHGG